MTRARRLIALLEAYAPTQREWGEIALIAPREAKLPEADIRALQRNLEDEWTCRRADRAT